MGGPSGARLIRRGNEQLSFGAPTPKERSVRVRKHARLIRPPSARLVRRGTLVTRPTLVTYLRGAQNKSIETRRTNKAAIARLLWNEVFSLH